MKKTAKCKKKKRRGLDFVSSGCSSAFQEADLVSSKDSGHGDSEQGDSDHDATNRGHSSGKSWLRLHCMSCFILCDFI